ncbi:Transcriptional repressor CTCF, partial [Stegodyphus mimosarum]
MEELKQEGEETSDIRNYLASFHKEIECEDMDDADSGNDMEDNESDGELASADELYVYPSENVFSPRNKSVIEVKDEEDEGESNFYSEVNSIGDSSNNKNLNDSSLEKSPRKKAAEIIRLGSNPPVKPRTTLNGLSDAQEEATIIPAIGEELHIDEQRALEMVAEIAQQAAVNSSQNLGLTGLESGSSYQTVTIVPSDTNPGELSYVVFMSDPNDCIDKNDENINMSVYDFNDGDQFSEAFLAEQLGSDGVKMRTIRLSARRTQIVTQQHVCNYCSYTSPKRYLLSRHLKSHSDERPHKCGVCERGFKTLASLQNHVNTHTGTRPHPCKECASCFTTSGELVRHVRYKHTHEKPHKCTECDYASVELSKLKRHMRCHTGERPYQCPHCTYASPDTYKLKRHLRIHTGEKPYECDICQTRFTQSNSLKAHKLIHSGNKPVFHCEYCPATCGRKTDLRIHMEKLHSSDNPHRCKRCGKVFLDRYSYKIHVKSHDGEKCFKCDLCNYASTTQRHLETHMFIHTDQKPYHCDECEQCFRQKQLLKRHKNIYHDPNYVRPEPKEKTHICSLCDKPFRHKGNLIRHYAIHDPEATASEREVAMRLGEPKEPGEDQDGEEDEDDLEYVKEDSDNSKDDQQVVVFEVIQLPTANGLNSEDQTVMMMDGRTLMLNGGEPQSYSIIQQADEDDGSNDFLNFSEPLSDTEDVENISSISSKTNPNSEGSFLNKVISRARKSRQFENSSYSNKICMQDSSNKSKVSNSRKSHILRVVPDKTVSNSESPNVLSF